MSIIITPAISAARTTAVASSKTEASALAGEEQAQASPSVTLSLSDYAKKRMAVMREATDKLRAMQAQQQESRKEAARQRLEEIKKRIELLKQLVVALGPEAAKGALRQIKQLAQELGQAASVLKESSAGAASPSGAVVQSPTAQTTETEPSETVDAVPAVSEITQDVEAGADAAPASAKVSDEASTSDSEAGDEPTAMQSARSEQDERQRRADGEELKKVARQLKQLLAMVKAQLSAKPDEDTKKLLGDIDKQLAATEKAATAMVGGGLSVSVSAGATLSITV